MEDKSKEIKKGIADLFNKVSVVFDGSGPRFFAYFGKRLVEFANIKKGEKVLDVASGKGASLFLAAEKVGEDGKVIGIDIAVGMVNETNLEIQLRCLKNAKIMVMDAEKLEFTREAFDHILCGFGVFFFPNYKVALDEFMRVLKHGGRFSFSTFLRVKDEKFIWLDALVEKYLPGFVDKDEEEDGPEFDTEDGLYKILNEANFKNIRIVSEEKTFTYKDEREWWDKLWTHGYIRVLEMIPEDKMEDFKREVFEKLRQIKESEGICATMFVLYACGEK
ncbi:MAG: class I SAM-dependent methyltransferase [Clostridiaceae bacterium]|nr:class I SAM-dependent methyltransferase [Clostridiaceae bacterium]